MVSHDYSSLGERALRLYLITKDPLTLSAAKILLAAEPNKPHPDAVARAVQLLEKQLAAYKALYTENL